MLANFPVVQWVKYGVSQRTSWVPGYPGWWFQWSSKGHQSADHHAIGETTSVYINVGTLWYLGYNIHCGGW